MNILLLLWQMAKQRVGSRILFGGLGGLLVIGVIVVIVLATTGVFSKKTGGSAGGIPTHSNIPATPGWGPSPRNPGAGCAPLVYGQGIGGLDPIAKTITIENIQFEILMNNCPTPSSSNLTAWFDGDFYMELNIDSVQKFGQVGYSVTLSGDASKLKPSPSGYNVTLTLALDGVPFSDGPWFFPSV